MPFYSNFALFFLVFDKFPFFFCKMPSHTSVISMRQVPSAMPPSILTNVCASSKIYFILTPRKGLLLTFPARTCVCFQTTIQIVYKSTMCELPTHHIHIQSIYNNLKRGLVVLTHQLLSSLIFDSTVHWVSCIMDVIGGHFTPRWIFNIEVNGALAIHIILHNSPMQNRNRLKFWIKDSYIDIYLLMTSKDNAKIKE